MSCFCQFRNVPSCKLFLNTVVILPMLRDSESLLKKDSGQARMTNGQARMTNGQARMTNGQARMTNGQARMTNGQASMTDRESLKEWLYGMTVLGHFYFGITVLFFLIQGTKKAQAAFSHPSATGILTSTTCSWRSSTRGIALSCRSMPSTITLVSPLPACICRMVI